MCGQARAFRDASWDEVSRWDAGWGFCAPDGTRPFAGRGIGVPRLVDVVRGYPGVRLNIDLKAPLADAAVSLLRAEQAEARVCLASDEAATLRRVRALGYAGPTGLARSDVAKLLALPAALQRGPLRPAGVAAQLPIWLAQRWVIARCHALGLRVDFWTVNDVPTARRLLTLGADGAMTDDPGLLAPILKGDAHG
jgi:glycerophosphoryl diester phosphodiesterase